MLKRWFLTLTFLWIMATLAVAGTFRFDGKTDKNALEYQPGEEIVFTVQLLEDGKPVGGQNLKWIRRGDDGKTEEGMAVASATEPLVVKTAIDIPGFVRITVSALDEAKKPLKNGDRNVTDFEGGAGTRILEIQGYPEPKDFDAYWAKQKARLAEVPLRADYVPVESGNEQVLAYDVKIDCIGKPASGYFCKPKNAAPKSLPARVSFHGYGVRSANKPVGAGMKALALDINAHGIENGQPAEYYQKLQQNELSGYAFSKEENENPETSYFNGMFLRLIRSLEFIKSQPEWDGKTLIVSGGSQGGLQCLAAAGLDPQVTLCQPYVPWCLDLGGRNLGRQSGWFPAWTEALGYFDAANHAKRIQGHTEIVAGLGDYVCPPSGQMVLYNNLKVPTKLTFYQGKTHGYTMPDAQVWVLEKDGTKNAN